MKRRQIGESVVSDDVVDGTVNKERTEFVEDLSFKRERNPLWIVALSFVLLTASGLIPPHRSGFTCDDPHIRKNYHGDSVSFGILIAGSILGPAILFLVTEAIHQSRLRSAGKVDSKIVAHTSESQGEPWMYRRFLKRCRDLLGDYMLGLLYLLAVVELGKVAMGELRPHFLDSCRPDWRLINCSQGEVTNYVCLQDMPKWLKTDIFKSFPSGHAALSAYTFIFSSMYSQIRISRSNYSHLLRSWVQLLFLMWAVICSVTRLTDNRHHWWDVAIGVFLGIVAGVFTAKCIVQNNFQPSYSKVLVSASKGLHSNSVPMTEVEAINTSEFPEKRTTSL